MNFLDPIPHTLKTLEPLFNNNAIYLNSILRDLDRDTVKNNMKLSDKLLPHVQKIIKNFSGNYKNGRQAIFTYRGAVFKAIDSFSLTKKQIDFAQNHFKILSGLYGVLTPLDGIEEYRMDMKTILKTKEAINMYSYWRKNITDYFVNINSDQVIINLASNEYSKVINFSKIKTPVLNISFGEISNNQIKYPPMYSKMARGLMAGYIIRNYITEPEELKAFNLDSYKFNENVSNKNHFIFNR